MSSGESDEQKSTCEEGNTHRWEVNRGHGCCEEFLWVVAGLFVEYPWQACDIAGILSSEGSNDQPLLRKCHNFFHHTIV